MKPVILTDIDGVVLNWLSNIPFFIAEKGLNLERITEMMMHDKFYPPEEIFGTNYSTAEKLLLEYNESHWISHLKAYKDAIEVINKLKDKYTFVAVTAIGTSLNSTTLRIKNLNVLFPHAFDKVYTVGVHDGKSGPISEAVIHYGIDNIKMFIDDSETHVNNILLKGYHVVSNGFDIVQMNRTDKTPYNPSLNNEAVFVKDWHDIEEILRT